MNTRKRTQGDCLGSAPRPRRWIYFDLEGIRSLHGQISGRRVVERTQMKSECIGGSAKVRGSLRAAILNADSAGEVTAARGMETSERSTPSKESLLEEVEVYLEQTDNLMQITCARPIAEIAATGRTAYGTGALRFRWAFSHNPDPILDAMAKQMVEFELDRDAHDDAGILSFPVKMGGSLGKCTDRRAANNGQLFPSSHLAIFLKHLGHSTQRLAFFGDVQPMMPNLVWIKPYAIWFP